MIKSINNDMLDELKELMEEDFHLLIETYISDADKRVEQLSDAIASNNSKEVRELAHSLKGSSSNLGAELLAQLSQVIENKGANDNLTGIKDDYDALQAEYTVVSDYFKTLV